MKKKRLIQVIAVFLCFVFIIGIVGTIQIFAAKESDKDYSFYRIASAAGAYYDDAHNPASRNKDKYLDTAENGLSVGDAGGLMGYVDSDYNGGTFGAMLANITGAAQTHAYHPYDDVAFQQYAMYGRALSELGVDHTGTEGDMSSLVRRFLSGPIMYLAYLMASSVDVIFGLVITLLIILNPFTWFSKVVPSADNFVFSRFNEAAGISADIKSALGGIAVFVSDIYEALSTLAWTVSIPFLFIILTFTLIMRSGSRRGVRGGAGMLLRKYATRVVFIVLGVPLIASLYTGALNSLASPSDSVTSSADYIVASTFIDFEAWVRDSHLNLPTSSVILVDTAVTEAGQVNYSKTANVKLLARSVNKKSGAIDLVDSSDRFKLSERSDDPLSGTGGSDSRAKRMSLTLDVLTRYMDGAMYHASDFEAEIKGRVLNNYSEDEYNQLLDLTNEKTYLNAALFVESNATDVPETPDVPKTPKIPIASDLLTNGNLSVVPSDSSHLYMNGGSGFDHSDVSAGEQIAPYGLSTLAMYNYLTTSFDGTSFMTHSSARAFSNFTRKSHYSVNVVGTGVLSFLYYLNSLVFLLVFTILGWAYFLSMVMHAVLKSFKLVASLPLAMLGSLRGMAQFTFYACMMLFEVIATVFMFGLVMRFLVAIQGIFDTAFSDQLAGSTSSFLSVNGDLFMAFIPHTAITAVTTLFSTVIMLAFGWMALKFRKSVIQSFDQFFNGLIDKFYLVNGAPSAGAGFANLKPSPMPTLPLPFKSSSDSDTKTANGLSGGTDGGAKDLSESSEDAKEKEFDPSQPMVACVGRNKKSAKALEQEAMLDLNEGRREFKQGFKTGDDELMQSGLAKMKKGSEKAEKAHVDFESAGDDFVVDDIEQKHINKANADLRKASALIKSGSFDVEKGIRTGDDELLQTGVQKIQQGEQDMATANQDIETAHTNALNAKKTNRAIDRVVRDAVDAPYSDVTDQPFADAVTDQPFADAASNHDIRKICILKMLQKDNFDPIVSTPVLPKSLVPDNSNPFADLGIDLSPLDSSDDIVATSVKTVLVSSSSDFVKTPMDETIDMNVMSKSDKLVDDSIDQSDSASVEPQIIFEKHSKPMAESNVSSFTTPTFDSIDQSGGSYSPSADQSADFDAPASSQSDTVGTIPDFAVKSSQSDTASAVHDVAVRSSQSDTADTAHDVATRSLFSTVEQPVSTAVASSGSDQRESSVVTRDVTEVENVTKQRNAKYESNESNSDSKQFVQDIKSTNKHAIESTRSTVQKDTTHMESISTHKNVTSTVTGLSSNLQSNKKHTDPVTSSKKRPKKK